jgi:hypothetical protein
VMPDRGDSYPYGARGHGDTAKRTRRTTRNAGGSSLCYVASLAAAALATAAAHGAQQADRFRYERPVITRGAGPQRLAVDVPLVARGARATVVDGVARNGLGDLRLFDRQGAPVQHLLVYAPSRDPLWTRGDILPLATTKTTSGFEADLGFTQETDAIAIDGLPAPFLKRLTLEGSGDRERWTVLQQEGTLFDLPAEQLRHTIIAFAPGAYRYLRVTWNDTNSGRLPPPQAVRARRVVAVAPAQPLTTPVTWARRPSEPGVSRYRLVLPGAGLPVTAIELEVPSGHVFRTAAIYESRISEGQAVPAELGRARLKQVERDGATAGDLRIPIAAPAEAELDLVIHDGNNPPLDLSGAVAHVATFPWIYFEAPEGPVIARFGNPAASPPAFDLEAMRDGIDLARVPTAAWGEVRPIEAADALETPAPPPVGGAALDPESFRYSREIAGGDAGLAALVLDAPVLAQSRGPRARFADVRIVDGDGRQVPYLVERRDEPLLLALALRPDTTSDVAADAAQRSRYRITLPHAGLPDARLVLETSARVFRREVQVAVEQAADRRHRAPWLNTVSTSTWTHANRDADAPALVLPLDARQSSEIVLMVDEGDNAPLPITDARLLLPSYRLRFYRPPSGPLRLVYGRQDLAPPQYDLALLAPQVMGAEARETTAAPPQPAARSGATFIAPPVFWGLLGVAVLVLLALIGRLVMRPAA